MNRARPLKDRHQGRLAVLTYEDENSATYTYLEDVEPALLPHVLFYLSGAELQEEHDRLWKRWNALRIAAYSDNDWDRNGQIPAVVRVIDAIDKAFAEGARNHR